MQFLDFIISTIITLASIIVLFFAFAKNNNLGRLSIFIIFGSLLLQQFIGVIETADFLEFTSGITPIIVNYIKYVEIGLLAILFLSKMKQATNKTFRVSLLMLIILKATLVLVPYFQ